MPMQWLGWAPQESPLAAGIREGGATFAQAVTRKREREERAGERKADLDRDTSMAMLKVWSDPDTPPEVRQALGPVLVESGLLTEEMAKAGAGAEWGEGKEGPTSAEKRYALQSVEDLRSFMGGLIKRKREVVEKALDIRMTAVHGEGWKDTPLGRQGLQLLEEYYPAPEGEAAPGAEAEPSEGLSSLIPEFLKSKGGTEPSPEMQALMRKHGLSTGTQRTSTGASTGAQQAPPSGARRSPYTLQDLPPMHPIIPAQGGQPQGVDTSRTMTPYFPTMFGQSPGLWDALKGGGQQVGAGAAQGAAQGMDTLTDIIRALLMKPQQPAPAIQPWEMIGGGR